MVVVAVYVCCVVGGYGVHQCTKTMVYILIVPSLTVFIRSITTTVLSSSTSVVVGQYRALTMQVYM